MLNAEIVPTGWHLEELIVGFVGVVTVFGVGLAWLLRLRPDLRDEAQLAADYTEFFADAAVRAAEWYGHTTGARGPDKLLFAQQHIRAAFLRAGIRGDSSHITLERVTADLEAAKARLFPPPAPPGNP